MKQYADPRMHTAEHILNQAMVRQFGCERCFSSHIEKKRSKCDYRFDREPTDAEIREVERCVNEVIVRDLAVTEAFASREEAASRCSMKRLPDDAGEKIRLVLVGDYDTCPCIGAHVRSTGEIGPFRITTFTFGDGVLRIRFTVD